MAKTERMELPHVAVGTVLGGRYRIERVLGSGGFSVVFEATQQDVERRVAIKLLRATRLGDDEARQRLLREVQLAKQLAHPNTVRLLDSGTTDQGDPFIAWELLTGEALSDAIRRDGAFTMARAQRVMLQVLASLGEAHARGIVHRDLKPSNIFLCQYPGESDFVKVLDFGMAKDLGEGGAGLTAEGQVLGTPAYMAPELALGRPADHRADLYAAGLVLNELLTGIRLLADTTVMRVCAIHASPEPLAIPQSVIASPFGQVVLRATDKDPARRYASALEMSAHLEQVPAPHARLPGAPTAPAPYGVSPAGVSVVAAASRPAPAAPDPANGPSQTLPAGARMDPSAPPVAAIGMEAPRGASSRRVLIAGIALATIGLCSLGAAAYLVVRAEEEREKDAHADPNAAADVEFPEVEAVKATRVHKNLQRYEIDGVSAQEVCDRLADRGWKVFSEFVIEEVAGVPSVRGVNYSMYVPGHSIDYNGVVGFQRFEDPEAARAARRHFAQTGAVVIDDDRLFYLSVSSDPILSEALLGSILDRE